MANDEIKIKYSIINSEFNSKIKQIGQSVKDLDKQFKLQRETMKHTASDSQKLEASLQNLQQKYELAKQKTEQSRQALEQAKQMFGENSKEAQKWSNALMQAETQEARLKNAITETNQKLEKAKQLESESAQASRQRQQALQNLSREHDKLKSSSEKLNKEYELQKLKMGENASYTERLKAKQEHLGKAFENSKQQVSNLEKQLEISKKEYGENSVQVDRLEKELLEAKIAMHKLGEEVKVANDKFGNFKNRASEIGNKMIKHGQTMTKAVTAPILAIGGLSIKAFNEVDKGLDIVISKTGATGTTLKGLKEDFSKVYTSFPETSEQVGNAIGEVNTQLGFTGEKLQNASKSIMEFAHINGADVTQSTLNAKMAIEQFNLSGEDLGMVLDVVTKTAQNTGQSVDNLFNGVVKGAPAFKDLGLSIGESTAWLGKMGQAGIDSSKSTTALTKAMAYFSTTGDSLSTGLMKLQQHMNSNASETEKLSEVCKIFGTKNGPLMYEAIKKGELNFSNFNNIVAESRGATHETFGEMTKDSQDWQISMNNLNSAGAELGGSIKEALLPILKDLTNFVRDVAEWFKALPAPVREVIVIVGLVVAAIGPLIVAIGGLTVALGALDIALLPFIGIVAAIALAIAGIILVIQNWGAICQWFGNLWQGICDGIKAVGEGIGSFFNNLWNGVKSGVSSAWNGIKSSLSSTWDGIKSACSEKFNSIKEGIGKTWDNVKSGISSAWNGIKSSLSSTWDGIKSACSEKFNNIKEGIGKTWDDVKSATSTAWSNIKSEVEKNGGGIKGVIVTAGQGYLTAWQQAFNSINQATGGKLGEALSIVTSKCNSIKQAFSTALENAKSTVRRGIEKIKSFFNFSWRLPKLKLPHFSVSGKFSLNPPQIPHFSVSWYKTGGIATGASVVGIGEAGNEAIVPLQGRYMQPFATAIADKMTNATNTTVIINMNNTIKETADFKKGIDIIDKELRRKGIRLQFGKGGI